MNARQPLRAVPSDPNSLPPYEPDTMRFRCTVEGVTLDTLVHYGDDFDLSAAAIWQRGVNIAPLPELSIDDAILNAYDEHRKELRDDALVERRTRFSH